LTLRTWTIIESGEREGEVAAVATRGFKATGLISRTGALLTSTG
jgi:hypothetical protein